MVEFDIKINPQQRLAYIPKEIAKTLGQKVKAVANRTAVLLYPEDVAIEDVLKSLEIIQADLKHGVALRKQKETLKEVRK